MARKPIFARLPLPTTCVTRFATTRRRCVALPMNFFGSFSEDVRRTTQDLATATPLAGGYQCVTTRQVAHGQGLSRSFNPFVLADVDHHFDRRSFNERTKSAHPIAWDDHDRHAKIDFVRPSTDANHRVMGGHPNFTISLTDHRRSLSNAVSFQHRSGRSQHGKCPCGGQCVREQVDESDIDF